MKFVETKKKVQKLKNVRKRNIKSISQFLWVVFIENILRKLISAHTPKLASYGVISRSFRYQFKRFFYKQEEEAPQNTENEENTNADEDAPESDPNLDYDYLLGMKMWSLTLEKKNELLKKRDEKQAELDTLKKKSPSDLWQEDLDALLAKVRSISHRNG